MDELAILSLHALALVPMAVALHDAVRSRRFYAFFFFGVLAYQLLAMPSITTLMEEFGAEIVLRGELIILLGATMLAASVAVLERMLGPRRSNTATNPVVATRAEWRVYLLSILACIILISAIVVRRGSSFIEANWEVIRAEATRLDAAAALLQFLVIPSAWVAFRSGHRVTAAALFAFALALFPVLGSRAALLTLPAVVALDVYKGHLDARQFRKVMVILAVVAIALHVVGRIVRGFGLAGAYQLFTGNLLDTAELAEMFSEIEWTGGEVEIARYFFVVVRDAPIPDAETLASPFRWLTMYLPRDMFEGFKPEDVSYALWRHSANVGVFDGYASLTNILDLLRSGDSGSVHPTIWGEMWLNGGLFAAPVFCMMLAAWLVLVDRLFSKLSPTLVTLVAPALIIGYFMAARGNSVIGLGYVAYLLPAAALLILIGRLLDRALAYGRLAGTRATSSEE